MSKSTVDEVTPQQAVDAMKSGSTMLKLTRSGGAPHFRFFTISSDHARLQVSSHRPTHPLSSSGHPPRRLETNPQVCSLPRLLSRPVALADIKEVRIGQTTEAFARHPVPEHETISFSLVYSWTDGKKTEDRTLDIVCKDKREFDVWVVGLRSLTLDPGAITPTTQPTQSTLPGDSLQVQFRGGTTVVHRTEMAADMYTFGEGANGRLGHGDEIDVLTPKVVEALLGRDVQRISAGPHTAALTGGGGLFVWGPGGNGRLGHGHERDRFTPLLVGSVREREVLAVSCGDHHTACITDDGQLYTWGKGTHGRLGYEAGKQLLPRPVESLKMVQQVSCGYISTAAIASGTLLTWGGGDKGQLGVGEIVPLTVTPTAILSNVQQVSCGSWHMACIDASGAVFTWGQGAHGKLGHGDEQDRPTPTPVAGLVHVKAVQVACGDYHTLVLADDGDVYSFGEGHYGQLGLGGSEAQYSPQPLRELHRVRRISAGSNHSAAVTEDGQLFTWGYGVNGRLGHGDEIDRLEPTAVESMIDKQVQEVACGASHTCVTVTHGWVPDGETSACMGCKAVFTFVRRRHHCRNCGGVFCGACTTHKYPLLKKGFSEAVRVCDKCHGALTAGASSA